MQVLGTRVASGVDTEFPYRVRIVDRGLIAATLFAAVSDSQILRPSLKIVTHADRLVLGEGKRGAQSGGVSQIVRVTGSDESQSVPPPN